MAMLIFEPAAMRDFGLRNILIRRSLIFLFAGQSLGRAQHMHASEQQR